MTCNKMSSSSENTYFNSVFLGILGKDLRVFRGALFHINIKVRTEDCFRQLEPNNNKVLLNCGYRGMCWPSVFLSRLRDDDPGR